MIVFKFHSTQLTFTGVSACPSLHSPHRRHMPLTEVPLAWGALPTPHPAWEVEASRSFSTGKDLSQDLS